MELLKELCITDANNTKGSTLYLLLIAQISHVQAKSSSWSETFIDVSTVTNGFTGDSFPLFRLISINTLALTL